MGRFRVAFANCFANTIVARDMNQANRVAYGRKRWRTVTLKGDIVSTSGSQTGGGRIRTGDMKLDDGSKSYMEEEEHVDPKEIEQWKRQRDELREENKKLTREKRKKE